MLEILIRSSKDLIDESKCVELQGISTLKLDGKNVRKKAPSDYSELHSRALLLAFIVEKMMDEITKVLVIDTCHCAQKEM